MKGQRSKKAQTRRLIREMVQEHLGEVKIQLPVRRREKGRFDFTGHEIEALRARADGWLAQRGLPIADAEREPMVATHSDAHRARIVHVRRPTAPGEQHPRRVSLLLSPGTHRVLGEQG